MYTEIILLRMCEFFSKYVFPYVFSDLVGEDVEGMRTTRSTLFLLREREVRSRGTVDSL